MNYLNPTPLALQRLLTWTPTARASKAYCWWIWYCGQELKARRASGIPDATFKNVHIEGFSGGAIYMGHGQHLHLDNVTFRDNGGPADVFSDGDLLITEQNVRQI